MHTVRHVVVVCSMAAAKPWVQGNIKKVDARCCMRVQRSIACSFHTNLDLTSSLALLRRALLNAIQLLGDPEMSSPMQGKHHDTNKTKIAARRFLRMSSDETCPLEHGRP